MYIKKVISFDNYVCFGWTELEDCIIMQYYLIDPQRGVRSYNKYSALLE